MDTTATGQRHGTGTGAQPLLTARISCVNLFSFAFAGGSSIVKSKFSDPRFVAAIGAAFSLAFGGAVKAQSSAPEFDTRSILVSSASAGADAPALRTRGLRVTRQYKNIGWSRVALAPGADISKTIAELRAQGLQVEPNYVRRFLKTPRDPLYPTQWGLDKIQAPSAWDVTTGGSEVGNGQDVVVAVLDSGTATSHPDLKANLYVNPREVPGNGRDDDNNGLVDDVNGYDFIQDNGIPDDGNQHGTHVAGTIGAVGNNRTGVTGVNWRVKILSCRVGTSEGAIFTSSVISALDYVVGLKKAGVNIRVTNNSYGGYGFSQAEFDAFKRASNVGILNVCAAGNDAFNNDVAKAYPASFRIPGLISVAASDQNDQPADFSNVGVRSVALAAPGVDILSTLPADANPNGGLYGTLSGTSMASPHVAGALALMLSQTPTMSMQQAQARLFASVDKLPQWRNKVATGGRLNVGRMLSGAIYAVSGKINRADGSPVSNVQVSLKVPGSTTPLATTTDEKGYYRFSSLAAGNYGLSAQLSGFSFAPASGSRLSFALGGTNYAVEQNLIAQPRTKIYSVFGVTYDFFGKPKGGVKLFVNSSPQAAAVSDSRGKYAIDDLVAGTYEISATFEGIAVRVANSNQAVKTVELPATSDANASGVQVDWRIPSIDNTSPTVRLTSPLRDQSYPVGQLKAVAGNAFDNDLLTTLEFLLYQIKTSNNGTQTFLIYNWETGTFSNGFTANSSKIIKVNRASQAFNLPLADLDAAEYFLSVTARDRSGNSSGLFNSFSVTTTGQPNPSPQQSTYPRFKFDYPLANSVVLAGRPFTAKGSAHADNGVQSLNFYLQQIDERGANLGYYDFTGKRWVSEQDSSTTVTQTFNGGTDVNWTLPMPALTNNRYVLHAYGIALDGTQPPADGSQDDNVFFRASTRNVSPTPTPAPSTSGS